MRGRDVPEMYACAHRRRAVFSLLCACVCPLCPAGFGSRKLDMFVQVSPHNA